MCLLESSGRIYSFLAGYCAYRGISNALSWLETRNIQHLVRIANQRRRTPGIPHLIILFGAAISLPSTATLRRVRLSPFDIFDIPLCRFPYFSRELKHLAQFGRRHPLHWLVKSRRNIELDNPCHSILRYVSFRQPKKGNPDAKVCVDCK